MEGAQLAFGACGALAEFGLHLVGRHFELERVDRQLGLDLEPARHHGEGFDEAAREHAVAAQHVGETVAEDPAHQAGQQLVAHVVAGPVHVDLALLAGAHHHVEPVAPQQFDHASCGCRLVSVVGIAHQVDIGLDIGEHPAHHVAFALLGLAPHDRARFGGDPACVVGRIVVVDVNRRFGQRGAEIGDHFRDSLRLVVAWQQDRDPRRGEGAGERFGG